jgi:hypothetical protein
MLIRDRSHMRRLSVGTCVLLLALAATVSLPAAAQWKWRDKSGQMQYSDLPPPSGTPDADILQRPPPVAPRPSAAASTAASAPLLMPKTGDPELEAKRKKAEQDEAAKKKAEEQRIAVAKVDNCSRARVQLKALDDGQRMSRINAKGEREYLDDKGRAEEAQRARSVISADCK